MKKKTSTTRSEPEPTRLQAEGHSHHTGGTRTQSNLTSFLQYPEKNKRVSEIRIQMLVPHPKMHLVTTFGAPATASSIPEGTVSTIIRGQYRTKGVPGGPDPQSP
ncbi:hypothetical protein TNCV_1102921 [Trichonephila clavipes]|nr:hypothetical protein TNCV_1102921 [Trichonephila clavipes]